MKRQKNWVAACFAALALGLALWVGAYYALVCRVYMGCVKSCADPQYTRGGRLAYEILAPVQWADRQLRPKYWATIDYSYLLEKTAPPPK